MYIKPLNLIVEAHGSFHSTGNLLQKDEEFYNGKSVMRKKILQSMGYKVAEVNAFKFWKKKDPKA